MEDKDLAIGIDLGTTYSCVAIWRNNKVEIIPNDTGGRTTPSVVSFSNKDRLIGEAAKSQITKNFANTVYDAKRLIGRLYDDKIVQEDIKHWPFKVVKNPENGKPQICVKFLGEEKKFYAEQISAMVLEKLKKCAKDYLGKEVIDAVITVPAYFNDQQRQTTKDAGKIAGLNVLRIINEPTAAAIAYGLDHKDNNNDNKILIFDLGGGTFDVSILSLDGTLFEVRATGGDTHLGGEDFDNEILKMCLESFKSEHGIDINANMKDEKCQKAYRRLKVECEKAKRNLSSSLEASIDMDALYEGKDLAITISRPDFEERCSHLFKKCLDTVESVLKDASLSKSDINDIVLVGGSTRIPKIQDMVEEYFSKEANKQINADEAVAYGAAVQAAIINDVEDEGLERLVLLDVTPLSLGTDVQEDIMSVIIPKNTTIPCKETQTYFTVSDNQQKMGIKIVQGERKFCKDNDLLGDFTLPLTTRGPAKSVKVDITLEVDINAILTVSAVEKGSSGNEKTIKIDNLKDRLTDADIDKLIAEAKKYEANDVKRKEDLLAKTRLQDLAYSINKSKIKSTTAKNKAQEIIDWIKKNPDLDKRDYDKKYNELNNL